MGQIKSEVTRSVIHGPVIIFI